MFDEPSLPARQPNDLEVNQISRFLWGILIDLVDLMQFEERIFESRVDAQKMREVGCDATVHMYHRAFVSDAPTVANLVLLECGCLHYFHMKDFIRPCDYHAQDPEQTLENIHRKTLEEFPEHYSIDSPCHWKQRQYQDDFKNMEELLKDVDI